MRPRLLLWFVALAGAAGCLNLKVPPAEIHEYRLDYSPPRISGQTLPVVIRVAPFLAAPGYDRAAIVYREGEYSMGAHFYERWMTDPASMIASLLTRDLRASGLYRAVQEGISTFASDYTLSGEVEEIEQRITANGCVARLRLTALLTRSNAPNASRVAFQKSYTADEPCSADDPAQFAAAMSNALEVISTDLQRDTYNAISQDRSA
jgi:ABC-type uncharacterized transport system auxiliary subunit